MMTGWPGGMQSDELQSGVFQDPGQLSISEPVRVRAMEVGGAEFLESHKDF